ncbi:Radical SAM domain protein [Treponema brennaborense DSM 12168]|uniref:Radical SAM domain protein n=2 Tax=Treponema TaxID=157 RepID=F4LPX8_TREBD|nr:Radical SAM domain protein [Treponema brennaborense DSM 12168]
MRVLLVGLGTRYNHVNLAVRTIAAYVNAYLTPEELGCCSVSYAEWPVSTPLLDLLSAISRYEPDAVLFSVYIWNRTAALDAAAELPKIVPGVIIGVGGPEVSYCAESLLPLHRSVDFVMSGEGENTVLDVCRLLVRCKASRMRSDLRRSFLEALVKQPVIGTFFRSESGVVSGGERSVIGDLALIPFPYRSADGSLSADVDPDHRIIYYESSRGCPFRCSYCLSSIDKSVRFAPLERVFADLQFFLDAGCRLVKFTDRTFNLDEQRYLAIWQYIIDHHNGKTVFHFEIAAQHLSDAALRLLRLVPDGAMQFEIGIQSIHPETLAQAGRPCDPERLAAVIRRIPRQIHVHLDLIAGLPYENFAQFSRSFDYTAALKPDMIQLGFLKILSGTAMETFAKRQPGYEWLSSAPYEVLSTPDMPYADLLRLKNIERLTDSYYNSGSYSYTVAYLAERRVSLFAFFTELADHFENRGLFGGLHKSTDEAAFLFDFCTGDAACLSALDRTVLSELLRFDFIRREKAGSFPSWYRRRYDKAAHNEAVRRHTEIASTRETFAATDYEEFLIHPETYEPVPGGFRVLFVYPPRGGRSEIRLKTEASSVKDRRVRWIAVSEP